MADQGAAILMIVGQTKKLLFQLGMLKSILIIEIDHTRHPSQLERLSGPKCAKMCQQSAFWGSDLR